MSSGTTPWRSAERSTSTRGIVLRNCATNVDSPKHLELRLELLRCVHDPDGCGDRALRLSRLEVVAQALRVLDLASPSAHHPERVEGARTARRPDPLDALVEGARRRLPRDGTRASRHRGVRVRPRPAHRPRRIPHSGRVDHAPLRRPSTERHRRPLGLPRDDCSPVTRRCCRFRRGRGPARPCDPRVSCRAISPPDSYALGQRRSTSKPPSTSNAPSSTCQRHDVRDADGARVTRRVTRPAGRMMCSASTGPVSTTMRLGCRV